MTEREEEKHLDKWIKALDREHVNRALKQCVEELIFTEEVRFYPDNDEKNVPYWPNTGTIVGQTEDGE